MLVKDFVNKIYKERCLTSNLDEESLNEYGDIEVIATYSQRYFPGIFNMLCCSNGNFYLIICFRCFDNNNCRGEILLRYDLPEIPHSSEFFKESYWSGVEVSEYLKVKKIYNEDLFNNFAALVNSYLL